MWTTEEMQNNREQDPRTRKLDYKKMGEGAETKEKSVKLNGLLVVNRQSRWGHFTPRAHPWRRQEKYFSSFRFAEKKKSYFHSEKNLRKACGGTGTYNESASVPLELLLLPSRSAMQGWPVDRITEKKTVKFMEKPLSASNEALIFPQTDERTYRTFSRRGSGMCGTSGALQRTVRVIRIACGRKGSKQKFY